MQPMIRLGHIIYSNCFPVHARLVDGAVPPDVELVPGVPSELNEQLARGRIDVAPCSSIEYARHADHYSVLPGLAIASVGAVQSILLESETPPEQLGGREVLVPTVSATSIALLRVLLEKRFCVNAILRGFDQGRWDVLHRHPHPNPHPLGEGVPFREREPRREQEQSREDPLDGPATAVLWIGDVALRRVVPTGRHVLDLGEAWTDWTGLPFAFAVWQARAGVSAVALGRLHRLLLESQSWFERHADTLAVRYASRFGIDADRLAPYWRSLRYTLDAETERGLLHFFRLAAELGEAAPVDALRWACAHGS